MKKILVLVLIMYSRMLYAQFPVVQGMASPTTRLEVKGAVDARKGLINGVYIDTAAANSDYIDFYNGAQIWTRSDSRLWVRDSILNMWVRLARFSELSGGGFFSPDQTSTGETRHNYDGQNFYHENIGYIDFGLDASSGGEFFIGRSSVTRFSVTAANSEIIAQDGLNKGVFNNSGISLTINSGDSLNIAGLNSVSYNANDKLLLRRGSVSSNRISEISISDFVASLTPTLQQVTDAGNITDTLIFADEFNVTRSSTSYAQLGIGIFAGHLHGALNLRSPNGGGNISSLYPALGYTDSRTHVLPNYSGTVAIHPTISGQAGKVLAVNGTEDGLEWITGGGGTPSLTQYRLAVGDASNLLSTAAAITGNRAVISDANGVPTHATTTATEIGYVNGVTSAIQTQLNNKEATFTETTEEFTGSTSMTITLANTPKSSKAETYMLNGERIPTANISRTGTSVTLSGFTRLTSYIITAIYSY